MRNVSLNIRKLFSISPCSVRRGSFCFLYIYSEHLNTCVNNLKTNKMCFEFLNISKTTLIGMIR